MKHIVLGITGASGGVYGVRLAQALLEAGAHLHLVVSPAGLRVLSDELGLRPAELDTLLGAGNGRLTRHAHRDIGASVASGSFPTAGMVICPCSGNTLAAVSLGLAGNLITRAAAVTLKEKRRLILVPREMPLGVTELRHMLRLARSGAIICPACPGFYARPAHIDDLVDFVVARVLDLLELPHRLSVRWQPRATRGDAAAGPPDPAPKPVDPLPQPPPPAQGARTE